MGAQHLSRRTLYIITYFKLHLVVLSRPLHIFNIILEPLPVGFRRQRPRGLQAIEEATPSWPRMYRSVKQQISTVEWSQT
jgi:hypothetical protein